MRGGSRGRPSPEEEIRKCVEMWGLDPTKVNVVSATSLAFVDCYLRVHPEDFISLFSRVLSEALYSAYQCGKVSEILTWLSRRLDSIVTSLSAAYHLFDVRLTTRTRLLVHTRSPTLPLEISLAWDPMFNVPFIPSSSLKGAARAYLELNNVTVDGLTPADIFGSQGSEGVAIFTDAYPVSCGGNSLVEPDVIAPHYSEARYVVDEPSASPIPLVFPAVAPNVTFRFVLAIAPEIGPQTALKVADKVSEALNAGLGAKTSVGYGRLQVRYVRHTSAAP